jgi:hypothetical protein
LGIQGADRAAEHGVAAALLGSIRDADIARISRDYEAGGCDSLNKLLDQIDATLPELSDIISHRYFFHSGPIQRLAEIERHP